MTGVTTAAFEPALDYCVVKIPRWPFDKFPLGDARLGTQMKSTGEVMAIARTFGQGIVKAVRGLDIGRDCLTGWSLEQWSDDELNDVLRAPTHERLFAVAECLRRGRTPASIAELTSIDPFWLWELAELVETETALREINGAEDPKATEKWSGRIYSTVVAAKQAGYADTTIARLSGMPRTDVAAAGGESTATAYRIVDTAAAEFPARSPYYYATIGEQDELRRPRSTVRRRRRQRSDPHRPGHRIRLLVRARRLGAARFRRRVGHGQQQSGDRVDRLRYLRRPDIRAAGGR